MIPINCPSTPAEGVTAEVVFVGKGTAADFEGKDLKGKIVFGDVATELLIIHDGDEGLFAAYDKVEFSSSLCW